jgi:PAS domain S-box-containing protein
MLSTRLTNLSIKKLLKTVLVLLTITTLVFSYFIAGAWRGNSRAFEKQTISNRVLTEIYQRRLIGDDYLLNPSQRAKDQWLIKQASIKQYVSSNENKFLTAGESKSYNQIKSGLNESSQTFSEVTKLFENGNNPDETLASQKARLASELSVKAEMTLSAAQDLGELSLAEAKQEQSNIVILLTTLAGIFILLLLGSFAVIWLSAMRLYNKEAEDAAILGSIGDGVLAIDRSKRIILFNRAAETLSGYKKSQAIGQAYDQVLKFVNEKDGHPVTSFIDTALNGEHAVMARDTALKLRDGSLLPVADSAAPIVAENGHTIGAVVVFRDITKERELERAKEEFLSLASHQLRTPATAVKQFLGLIIEGYVEAKKEIDELIKNAYSSNEQQLNIIDDILNVAKIEAGKFELKKEPADIVEIVNLAVAELKGQAEAKSHQLILSKPTEAIPLTIDKLKITMCVQNLISNAIKYTPEMGNIRVELKDSANEVIISVQDDGIGISEKDREKLFNKFSRIQNDYTTKIQGTGLGLYLVKQLVELHGGSIEAKSAEPKGSLFIIRLPKEV